jgi:hypothetical protein
MGFAVHTPAQRPASPRSRGMPCRDVQGRIQISVTGVAAGVAPEDGLALARLPIHMPARAAALRSEHWIDLLDPPRSFVLQAPYQQSPPGSEDFPVQSGLLPYIPAGLRHTPSGGPGHVLDAQIFDPDDGEPTRQVCGELLCPVLPYINLASPQPGDRELDTPASQGPWLSAGKPTLQQLQSVPSCWAQPWHTQHLACGQSSGDGHAAVNSDDLAGSRFEDRLWDCGKGDVPAVGPVAGNPIRLRVRDRTRPTEPDPARLWDPNCTSVAAKATYVSSLHCNDPEALIPNGLAPGGLGVGSSEEVRHRLGEIPQRLLLNHLTAGAEPIKLTAGRGQLSALLQVAGRPTASGPPVRLLLACQVPYISCVRAVFSQLCLLVRRWHQAVAGHANTLSRCSDIPEEVKRRRTLPTLSARDGSTPRLR